MLKFKHIQPEDIPLLRSYLDIYPYLCSDVSLGYLLMNHVEYDVSFALWNETMILRMMWYDDPMYYYPFGKDPDGALEALREYCTEKHLPMTLYGLPDELLQTLPVEEERIRYGYDRRWSDYIYAFTDIRDFRGKKFRGQRNHINKFHSLYGEEQLCDITPEDIPLLHDFLAAYHQEHTDGGLLEYRELKHCREFLDILPSSDFYACCLKYEGRVIGFTVGEVRNDTLVIHIEKALKAFEGAYPVLFHAFVNRVGEMTDPLPLYINREDDAGDPGLRTSKMQYQPVRILHKYCVHYNSPLYGMDEMPVIRGDGVYMDGMNEADIPFYFRLNTDEELNRLWGYDYHEDEGLPWPLTERCFYDSAMTDFVTGETCSLAVRTREGGEMIGELVLYRFALTGETEIGCRIDPALQGNGYGTAAFTAAVRYVRDVWHGIPCARCYKTNPASRQMILNSGLSHCGSDAEFEYFR